jgi:alpha-tubulin suppressor-like RCC1 family protein
LGPVRAIATAYLYSAALKTDGTVVTWGDFNGGNTNQPAGVTGVVAIASAGHMVALRSDGTVVTWGAMAPRGLCPPA